jgi:hypothetical protein
MVEVQRPDEREDPYKLLWAQVERRRGECSYRRIMLGRGIVGLGRAQTAAGIALSG